MSRALPQASRAPWLQRFFAPLRHRELLFELARNDFRARHKGSLLGTAWAFAQPVLTIVLYLFIYKVGLRPAETGGVPFVLWLIVGITPWFFFTDAVSAMTSSLVEYKYLVKKVVFEVTIIPAIKLLSSIFVALVVWGVVLLILTISGYPPRLAWLQIPYYFLAVTALASGLGLMTSAITPFFRDLSQVVAVAVQFGVWLTPVLWPLSNAPPRLVPVLELNPVHYVIQGLREALLLGKPFWSHPALTVYFWLFVLAANVLGLRIFGRLRPHLADVL